MLPITSKVSTEFITMDRVWVASSQLKKWRRCHDRLFHCIFSAMADIMLAVMTGFCHQIG